MVPLRNAQLNYWEGLLMGRETIRKLIGVSNAARIYTAPPTERGTPCAPADMRIYAIGDIHGRADLLSDLIKKIEADGRTACVLQKIVVLLGDYIDRGPDSREVVDILLDNPLNGFGIVCLRGNHEEAALKFLDEPDYFHAWRTFGAFETLRSYGVASFDPRKGALCPREVRDAFRRSLPAEHLAFLCSLPTSVAFGDYFFAHAGVQPTIPLTDQIDENLLWIREEFLESAEDFGKIVVHGHSPTEKPDIRLNRIGIDTGAYLTDTLTCLVLEGTTQRYLQSYICPQ